MSADLETRLAALEARVQALEGQAKNQVPAALDPSIEDGFWALKRLQTEFPQGGLVFAGVVHLPTGETWRWKELQDTPEFLAAPWEAAAPALAALGHPLRLKLLWAILHGQQTTADFQHDPHLAAGGKLYHHLKELQSAGWLTTEGRGRYVVPAQKVIPLLIILRATGAVAP